MLSPQAQAVKANKGVKVKPVKPVPSPQGLGLSQSDITKTIKQNLRPQVEQMAAGGATRGQVSSAIQSGNFPITAPTATPVAPPPPPTPFNYADAFLADYRYKPGVASIAQQQLGLGQKYGYTLNRDTNQSSPTYGMAYYRKPQLDASGKQMRDENGNFLYESKQITAKIDPVTGTYSYVDPSGKTYDVNDLELDVVPIARGQAGYLEGALGSAEAQSAVQQQKIGESAAQAGARRSGMRAQAALGEVGALQSALGGLSRAAGGEFVGTTQQYADLLGKIFPDLAKSAGGMAAAESPVTVPSTPTIPPAYTPGVPSVGGVTIPQKPLPQAQSFSVAGQTVALPKGIDLSGVDVRGIGDRIANNVRTAGGVGKLKPGQMVGQFRAGGKGYVVRYKGGRFVIESAG